MWWCELWYSIITYDRWHTHTDLKKAAEVRSVKRTIDCHKPLVNEWIDRSIEVSQLSCVKKLIKCIQVMWQTKHYTSSPVHTLDFCCWISIMLIIDGQTVYDSWIIKLLISNRSQYLKLTFCFELCKLFIWFVLGVESTTCWLWGSHKAFPDNWWCKKPRIF